MDSGFVRNRQCQQTLDPYSYRRGYGSSFSGYNSGGMRYYADWNWFPEAAKEVLLWFQNPLETEDQEALYNEIRTGDDLDGLLEIGKNDGILKFYIILTVIGILGILSFLGGIGYFLFKKNEKTPENDKNRRVKMIPLFLVHIPIFLLILFFLILFSMNLWSAFGGFNLYSDETSRALKSADEDLKEITRAGNCNFQVYVEDGMNSVKERILRNTEGLISDCDMQNQTIRMTGSYEKDQKQIEMAKEKTAQLLKQLKELKDLNVIKSNDNIDVMTKVVENVQDSLDDVHSKFDKILEEAQKTTERVKTQTKKLSNELDSINSKMISVLREFENRLKATVFSVHSALTKAVNWINLVGKRMLKMRESVKKEGDPVTNFILAQLAVAIPSLLALIALPIGFLALAVRIAYPKALLWFPELTKKTRRTISIVFFAQCLLVGVVALTTGIGLYYASSMSSVCEPLFIRSYYNDQVESFYKTNDLGLEMKDFDGNTHKISFSDLLKNSQESDSMFIYGSENRKLIPELKNILDTDDWFNDVIRAFEKNPIEEVEWKDNSKITEKLDYSVSTMKNMDFGILSKENRSPLVTLVVQQINSLVKELEQMRLDSLKPYSTKCNSIKEVASNAKATIQDAFESNVVNFEKEFNRNIYRNRFIYETYMGTGRSFCVEWGTPASGVWFAGTFLSMVLLISAVVMFKTVKNLRMEASEETQLTDSTSVSTIYAPLIDSDKSPTEREI